MKTKTTQSQLQRISLLIAALLFGLVSASFARADHNQPWRLEVRDHADNVMHLARNIRQEILHVGKHSQLFGQMLAETGKLEGNAAVLKAWTYHEGPFDLQAQIQKLTCTNRDLQSLLDEAQFRSDRGLDRQLLCTIQLRQLLNQVDAQLTCAVTAIPQAIHVGRPVIVQPQPPIVYGPHFGGPTFQIDQRPTFQFDFNSGPRIANGHPSQGRPNSGRGNFQNNFNPHGRPGTNFPNPGYRNPGGKQLTPSCPIQGSNIYGTRGRSNDGIAIQGRNASFRIGF